MGGETTYYARWSRQDKDSPRDSKNVSRNPEQHCCQHKQPTKNCEKKRNTTTDVGCRVVHEQDKRSHRESATQAAKQKDEKTKLEQKICVVQ